MQVSRSGRSVPRVTAAVAVLGSVLSLLVVPSLAAHAAPPNNPTDTQLGAAQAQKNALANRVGALQAQSVVLETQMHQLLGRRELAEQKLAYSLQLLDRAKAAAVQARAAVDVAQSNMLAAQQEFVSYAQAAYMSGNLPGTTGALLTAQDPNVLLQRSALQQYQSSHQISAVGDLQRASVAKSNADAAARQAVQLQSQATDAAATAKNEADDAVRAASQQQARLQASLNQTNVALSSAATQLATLNGERAQYVAYVKEQERLAEIRRQQQIEAARQAALAAARAAAAAAAAAGSGGGGGGGGGDGGGPVPVPVGGSWSLAKGQEAASRAERYLGWMYAWAGGNAGGPTRGVCAGDGAFNDCNVIGFDCSGLAMYAWGPWISLDHYAAAQYTQAGSYHPDSSSFEPGDLLFWSSDGTVAGIHHVAIYVGNGNVIQAPQSGEVIQITPWDQVSWGYFGATRPLT